nr:RES family NAD+ phosphorylase [[Mycobacterium] fortunisiensis]
MGATEFNGSEVSRRFRPIYRESAVVPTLYGADMDAGALSETVLHDVPVRGGGRRIQRKNLVHQVLSTIIPTIPLNLVELHGAGLRRLQITHGELIESGARHYPRTAEWSRALYEYGDEFHGLAWRSRQFNDSIAVMLWGDRVNRFEHLRPEPDQPPLPLFLGEGYERVMQLANDFDITVVG